MFSAVNWPRKSKIRIVHADRRDCPDITGDPHSGWSD